MVYDYFQSFLIFLYKQSTPLIIFLDGLHQYYYEEKEQQTEEEKFIYDYENDIMTINYSSSEKNWSFIFERKLDIDIKNTIETKFKNTDNENFLMMAELNGVDITNKINKYCGPSGIHLEYSKIQIKNLLTDDEIKSFEKLLIIDEMCNEKEFFNIDDVLELD